MERRSTTRRARAAKLCDVSQQTIIRCFDAGLLRGFKVPGSKFRRIGRIGLLEFALENGIPIDEFGPLDDTELALVAANRGGTGGRGDRPGEGEPGQGTSCGPDEAPPGTGSAGRGRPHAAQGCA